jgi:endonuclease/exonuclease/phosphatase family metal-dependent hydrolase
MEPTKSNRRTFLKTLGALTAAPLLVRSTGAQETTATATGRADGDTHRILCANILLASDAHKGTPADWSVRKHICLKVLKDHQPDILCTQEVLRVQAEDMAATFPGHTSYGFVGPYMDQHPEGYHLVTKNVILFSSDRYEMTSAGNYWLSETPLIANSVSWDALRARHVNWVRLRDKRTGREFRVINTHFDHKGKQAREEQAKMIVKEAAQYHEDFPQILAGDLNAIATNKAISVIKDAGWTDTYTAIHGPEDPGRTFHALEGPAYKPGTSGKIDFIFARGKVTPVASEIIRDNVNGSYPSDHYFLSADVRI